MAAQYIEGRIQEWNEIAAKCSRMIAPCNEIADAMIQNGLDAGKVHILPHGIPLPDHRPDYPAVINGRVKFYYVGRIDYTKGIHILLEAFSKVNDEKIELHLIGGTAYKQEKQYMQTLQEKYRKDPRIVWHGKVAPEAVYEMTKDFHVSCAASICLESFGLNIAEALVLGKPVLASRCGGGEMQIEDGVNGWLVPANDVSALAEKIRYIANHTEILPRLSANCRAISIQDHCKQLLEIYQDCQNHG
jgi:glycosyltransferase involved in cell wall biosynthesis